MKVREEWVWWFLCNFRPQCRRAGTLWIPADYGHSEWPCLKQTEKQSWIYLNRISNVFLCLFVWDRILHYRACWPGTHYVAQGGPRLTVILMTWLFTSLFFVFVSLIRTLTWPSSFTIASTHQLLLLFFFFYWSLTLSRCYFLVNDSSSEFIVLRQNLNLTLKLKEWIRIKVKVWSCTSKQIQHD